VLDFRQGAWNSRTAGGGSGIPADGVVREGKSDVNESMITGESAPADAPHSRTSCGSSEQAQTSRSRAQALADRAAIFLTLVAIVAGAVTLVVWISLGATGAFAVERVVAVLVIACPHALGLAVPLVIAISTTLGARSGLLVRDRRGLEEARHLTTVVFDKTGTLTRGEFRVVDIATNGSVNPAKAAGSSEYNGKTFYFCSKARKTNFDANPAQYAK
jgi:P-type Cu2+ transporter